MKIAGIALAILIIMLMLLGCTGKTMNKEAAANSTINPSYPIINPSNISQPTINSSQPQPNDFCATAKCTWWEVCDNSSKSCIPKSGYENKTFGCSSGYYIGEDGYCHLQAVGGNSNGSGSQILIGPDGKLIYPGNQQCLSYKSCQECIKAAQASSGLTGCKWFPDSGTCIDMAGGIDKTGDCDAGKAGAGGTANAGGTAVGAGKNTGTGGGSIKYVCPTGYVMDQYDICHPQCGQNNYCPGDSQCYSGECRTCQSGEYLGTDGNCYSDNGGQLSCPQGYVSGDDKLCHSECGSGIYCTGDSQCYNGECISCSVGEYLGTDGNCYSEIGGGSCDSGFVAGNDGYCHPECGSGIYCTGDEQCFNGECLSCSSGDYLGTDGNCHPQDGGCNPGYVEGSDNLCHPQCSPGIYCTGDSQCYNGQCLSCSSGEYLGTDGNCHSEGGECNPGYVAGSDNLCHPECSPGIYCTGDSQCFNGQCLSCSAGDYLGTDGNCHSENGGGTGELTCPPGTYQVTGTLCCPNGEYYGGDGYCYYN